MFHFLFIWFILEPRAEILQNDEEEIEGVLLKIKATKQI